MEEKMTIEEQAKMETLEEITKKLEESGVNGMTSFAMGMQTMMAITKYQEKIAEKIGTFTNLIEALESGGFSDGNGTTLTDTITFKQLKNRIIKDS